VLDDFASLEIREIGGRKPEVVREQADECRLKTGRGPAAGVEDCDGRTRQNRVTNAW
jgi:hypothetical protein